MGLLKALGKLQPKKICDGGGCERKHEAVNQSGKEQDFQGAANAIFKRSYLKNMEKKVISLQMDKTRKQREKEKELGKEKSKGKKKRLQFTRPALKMIERGYLPVLRGNANSPQKWKTLCSLCVGLCHTKKGLRTAVTNIE